MNNYYVTFGQKYIDEPHPTFKKAHPDGWYLIQADNLKEARNEAFQILGQYWSFIYKEEDFNFILFPLGQLNK